MYKAEKYFPDHHAQSSSVLFSALVQKYNDRSDVVDDVLFRHFLKRSINKHICCRFSIAVCL